MTRLEAKRRPKTVWEIASNVRVILAVSLFSWLSFEWMNEQILFLENIQKNEAKLKAIQPDVASLREVYNI